MKTRKRTAIYKAKRDVFLVELFAFTLFIIMNLTIIQEPSFLATMFVVIFLVFAGELLYRLQVVVYQDQEEREISKMLVEEKLSTEEPIEVILLKDNDYEKEFFEDLSSRAKFYAIIEEDYVLIIIQYEGEDVWIPFQKLEKHFFSEYYGIKKWNYIGY